MLRKVDTWVGWAEVILVIIASAVLFAMMVITSVDVVLRYGFNEPLTWAKEVITQYLLPILFFGSLSYALRKNDHVRLNTLSPYISSYAKTVLAIVTYTLSLVLFTGVTYGAFTRTIDSWQAGSLYTGVFITPAWTLTVNVVVGATLICLRLLVIIARLLNGLIRNNNALLYEIELEDQTPEIGGE